MKLWQILVVVALAGLLAWGLWNLLGDKQELQSELSELRQKVGALKDENSALEGSIDYYSHPQNLLKELKSRFNYREEGEKLIILVPGIGETATTSASSTGR
jgi:cell division protein FtsB